jgi:hypothetical protein
MPPVTVYYHEAAVAGSEDAFRVPGMESEMILPPPNNLSAKGRPMGERRRTPATAGGPPSSPRPGSGRYGVRNFGDPTPPTPQPGVLTGNGSVFIGTEGIMATVDCGEGVHLLPAERWAEYTLPPQLLTRSPGHMLDWVRTCKGGDPACSDFSVSAPYAEWLALVAISLHVPGKLEWDARNMRFTNSPETNRFVKPLFRKGTELKL